MVFSSHLSIKDQELKNQTQVISERKHLQIHEQLPQNREHGALQYIRQYPRLESASEQAAQTVRGNDRFGGFEVADTSLVHLAVGLDDAQGVGDGVGYDGSAETDESLSADRAEKRSGLGEVLAEEVVRCEPL